jgi:hypothetical protein
MRSSVVMLLAGLSTGALAESLSSAFEQGARTRPQRQSNSAQHHW